LNHANVSTTAICARLDLYLRDDEITGFALRIASGGAKSFVGRDGSRAACVATRLAGSRTSASLLLAGKSALVTRAAKPEIVVPFGPPVA
jgi:hypothetical protein